MQIHTFNQYKYFQYYKKDRKQDNGFNPDNSVSMPCLSNRSNIYFKADIKILDTHIKAVKELLPGVFPDNIYISNKSELQNVVNGYFSNHKEIIIKALQEVNTIDPDLGKLIPPIIGRGAKGFENKTALQKKFNINGVDFPYIYADAVELFREQMGKFTLTDVEEARQSTSSTIAAKINRITLIIPDSKGILQKENIKTRQELLDAIDEKKLESGKTIKEALEEAVKKLTEYDLNKLRKGANEDITTKDLINTITFLEHDLGLNGKKLLTRFKIRQLTRHKDKDFIESINKGLKIFQSEST